MPLYNDLPSDIVEADVIIAGGGTAGSVIASRLSDADPSLSILVLESGASAAEDPTSLHPMLFVGFMDPSNKGMVHTAADPEERVANRGLMVPQANVLGGGSSVNMMTYSRPYSYDIDSWGVPGWSYDETLPYFKKFENYQGPGEDDVHGKGGPIDVSVGSWENHKTRDDYIAAATKVGYPEKVDIQDFKNPIGSQRNLKYISKDGKRQDVATKYLLPRLEDGKHNSLHVALNTKVEKILFDDNKRAVGVVCFSGTEDAEPREIRAKRQVIVSCGTLVSPQVLQRSGVADRSLLEKAGVPLVAENSAVGEGFQDHLLILCAYNTDLEPGETIDDLLSGKYDVPAAIEKKDPRLGWTCMDAISQVRPSSEQVKELGSDFATKFDKYWGQEPTKVLGNLCAINGFPGILPPEITGGQYFSTSSFATYPFARGHIRITGPKSSDPARFETGFLADEGDFDLKALRYLYKTQREVVRRMNLYRGELALTHPKFPAGSAAGLHDGGALEGEIKDLVYSAEDDAAIDAFTRNTVATTWHGLGTCKMGRKEDGGAVDANLDVYGVSGLKVADLSIIGGNVAANTNATALMIGEKASDILIREMGLAQ